MIIPRNLVYKERELDEFDIDVEGSIDKILYDNRAIQHRIKWNDEMYYIIRAEDAYCVVE